MNKTKNALNAVIQASEYSKNYVREIHTRTVKPTSKSIENLKYFDKKLPKNRCPSHIVLNQLNKYAAPATMASTGGRYFGLVVGGSTPASMGAMMMSTAWDQVAFSEMTAPSAVYLEKIAARWLLDLLAMPDNFSVGFTTGSSVANLIGLVAARNAQYKKMGINIGKTGLYALKPLKIVMSEQAHVTLHKALGLAGFGTDQFIKVPCDNQGRVLLDQFPEVSKDTIVILQAGNVNSGASDPFDKLIPQLKSKGAWVHVDGAFGLWAAASPAKKQLVKGVQLADSWSVDAHKWLNTPYDCGIAICREPKAIHDVMSTVAPYLKPGVNVPPKDMVPEFSRRARGVEVWAAIKEMGRDGVIDLIDRCCLHAQKIADGLQQLGYETLNDVVLNQVVATIGNEADIHAITKLVQDSGECWFGTTFWRGKHAVRLSISSWVTTSEDIECTLKAIECATNKVMNNNEVPK